MTKDTCTIEGCTKPVWVKTRGLCQRHYSRWRDHGDPLGGGPDRQAKPTTCQVDDCSAQPISKGLCQRHYARHLRHGDPLGGGKGHASPGEPWRFYLATVYLPSDDCKIWPYGAANGYGALSVGGRQYQVHRLACQAWHGPQPAETVAAHGPCHDTMCYNGQHLSWEPAEVNSRHMWRDGTVMTGSRNHASKLTADMVVEIRTRYAQGDITQWDLAHEYGLRQPAVSSLLRRETWAWVADPS